MTRCSEARAMTFFRLAPETIACRANKAATWSTERGHDKLVGNPDRTHSSEKPDMTPAEGAATTAARRQRT